MTAPEPQQIQPERGAMMYGGKGKLYMRGEPTRWERVKALAWRLVGRRRTYGLVPVGEVTSLTITREMPEA